MLTLAMGKHFIKEWRKHRRLTQKTLADRMEESPGEPLMSHVTISNIERGSQSPTLEQLNAIADALDVNVASLIGSDPRAEGEVVDLLRLINDKNRDTVMAMLRAAVGQ